MDNSLLTYYKILGVSVNATTEEIQRAYRDKAKQYHPDRNGGGQAAHDMFNYLGQAKEWLTDPQKRLEYDYLIGVRQRPAAAGAQNQNAQQQQRPIGNASATSAETALAVGALGLIVGVALGAIFGSEE